MSVFIILTGENWPTIMYNALAGRDLHRLLLLLLFWILGGYFLLNLVLATLLSQSASVVGKRSGPALSGRLGLEELRNAIMLRHLFKRWLRVAAPSPPSGSSSPRGCEAALLPSLATAVSSEDR